MEHLQVILQVRWAVDIHQHRRLADTLLRHQVPVIAVEESRSEQEDHYKWRICMNRVKKFITGIIFLVMLTVSLNVFA